jgi:hypothetical protein
MIINHLKENEGFKMKYFKELYTKKFGVYFLRWQISAIVMMPFMMILEMFGIPLFLNLILGQAIGSFIFFEIDKWIFKEHKTDNIEDILSPSPSVSERKL